MSCKRSPPSEEEAEPSVPTKRAKCLVFETVKLPAVSTVSDLDRHALVFQNRKLAEQLFKQRRTENDLRRRIEQLERRQTQDDAMICIINLHWNRLDEDVRILLQRFDAETAVEMEAENEAPVTTSFINQLSQWDKSEVNNRLSQRVEFSRRAIGKLVQAFDRITQRNERITERLKELKGGDEAEGNRPESDQLVDKALINEAVVSMNAELQEENSRLQREITKLQHKNHTLSMENSKLEERFSAAETGVEEMRNQLEEARYAVEKAEAREDKLDYRLSELVKQHQALELQMASLKVAPAIKLTELDDEKRFSEVSKSKVEELQVELEEQRELATNRLSELRELNDRHKSDLQEVEKLKLDLNYLPEEVIKNSTEFKCLQSAFSVLFNDLTQTRNMYEDARYQLITAKTAHLKQIEQMEQEELLAQKQLRSEMVLLEDQTSQVRREYEMLRLEFEQNLAAHEQSGPVLKEMRQLLASYKTQNQQLKAEIARYKKKWRECVSLLTKTQRELEEERKRLEQAVVLPKASENDTPLSPAGEAVDCSQLPSASKSHSDDCALDLDSFENEDSIDKLRSIIRMLKQERPTNSDGSSDDKTSGDIKIAPYKKEAAVLKENLKRMIEAEKANRKKLVDEESARKIKQLDEQVEQLKRDFSNCKQEEDALLSEMEVTGQAFEDMQEQNARLVLQLREKDDANFKLMSDRIRSNQQFKLVREEKGLVEQQVVALQNQVEAQNLVVRKLEDKERLLQNNLATVEKELNLRQQALELHKRKALEAAQSSADLKLQLEKLQAQLADASAAVSEKTATIEEESFKMNRLQEEISMLKKKLERSKKMEKAETVDEVLLEEIRELKSQLTCTCCRVNPKNAILLKCSHVFCFDCLKTRYETRQRKCPKCNGQFGANDYRRIFF